MYLLRRAKLRQYSCSTYAGGKFPVGVFAYPKGSTGHSVNLVQGLGFVLMTGHSSVQDHAAGTFLRWWFTPQVQAKWAMESGNIMFFYK